MKNGRLLSLMEAAGFDVVVTSDGSMYHQQNFRHRRIVLVVLPTNNKFDLAPKIDLLVKGIEDAKRDRRHVFLDFPLRRRPR